MTIWSAIPPFWLQGSKQVRTLNNVLLRLLFGPELCATSIHLEQLMDWKSFICRKGLLIFYKSSKYHGIFCFWQSSYGLCKTRNNAARNGWSPAVLTRIWEIVYVSWNRKIAHFRPGSNMHGRSSRILIVFYHLNKTAWIPGMNKESSMYLNKKLRMTKSVLKMYD